MNAETILRSDLLDIIFENRNKQYGAYQLRKEYNSRLQKALSVILSLVIILFTWDYIQHHRKPGTRSSGTLITINDSVKFTPVDLPKELPPPVKSPPTLATVKNLPPVIAPDNQVHDTLSNIKDLEDRVISTETKDGDKPTSDNQPLPVATAGNDKPVNTVEPVIFENPELMPEFPGGTAALLRFLGKNLQVPDDALEPGQKVRVPVKFVVTKDGNLSSVEFLSQAGDAFRKEIMRVMAKMPKWKPGSQHGQTVAVYFTIPVIFDMTEN